MGYVRVRTVNYERMLRAYEEARFDWLIEEARLIEEGRIQALACALA